MTLVLKALKLLGLDVPARIHTARVALELLAGKARDEIRRAARYGSVSAAFAAIALLSAMAFLAVGLAALYLYVSDLHGPYAGLAAVAAVLVVVAAASGLVAVICSRPAPHAHTFDDPANRTRADRDDVIRDTADGGIGRDDASVAAAGVAPDVLALVSLLLGRYLASPANPPLPNEGLHQLRVSTDDPGDDALELAARVVSDGDRTNMLAVLAGAAFMGWLVARPPRDHRA